MTDRHAPGARVRVLRCENPHVSRPLPFEGTVLRSFGCGYDTFVVVRPDGDTAEFWALTRNVEASP